MDTLKFKTTVKWASMDDMTKGGEFASERQKMLDSLTSLEYTDGVVERNDTEFSGSIKFVDEITANEWVTFVQGLATKYGKNIASTEITSI